MKVTGASHVDHGLTQAQIAWLVERFADKAAFFIETVELPEALGTVPCGLYGPLMGDSPVTDVWFSNRAPREYTSRLCNLPPRPTRLVTLIAGPHEGEACILYTAFGGPLTPQEPGDPSCKDVATSTAFWSKHALATG